MIETARNRLSGVVAPLLTPHDPDHSIAEDLYLEHAAGCLAEGAHYLSPFGTTSEATSHSMTERMAAVELLVDSGAARADQLMPGTGLCSMQETLSLTRHAVEAGCRAAMILPPFFFVNATDEGLCRYFSQLIERVGSDDLRVCLYTHPADDRDRDQPGPGGAVEQGVSRHCRGLQGQLRRLGEYRGGDPRRAGDFGLSGVGEFHAAGHAAGGRWLYLGQLQFQCRRDPGDV